MSRRTLGRWELRGVQIRADGGHGCHVGTYQRSRADGLIMAAAPELLEMLLNACASLDAAESGASSHGTANDIRARLAELRLITLGVEGHGWPSEMNNEDRVTPDERRTT